MDNSTDQPKFYTTEEVAEMLRVKPESVRRYVRTGKLRAVKLGGKFIRIDQKDFEDFIEKMKINPQKASKYATKSSIS